MDEENEDDDNKSLGAEYVDGPLAHQEFDDQGNIISVKRTQKTSPLSSEGPSCKINRNSIASIEMKKIVKILDGAGEKPKKAKGRSKKDELENILNTTLSIKTFAQVDEDKQKV